jgi:hypothetical protein
MSRAKSIAQKLAALVTLLPFSAGIALSPIHENRAVAQPTQGALGQCILDLREANIYGSNAADRCINQLQNLPPTQSLGQCILDLRQANIYGSNAADRCERLLAAQQRNGGQSFVSRPSSSSRRAVRINNNTGGNIIELYLSPASSDDWGANRLNGTFNSGYFINFTLGSSECIYDIRADFDDGSYVQDQFDFCRSNTYNLN